jgi:opacity protein-like surface antigen
MRKTVFISSIFSSTLLLFTGLAAAQIPTSGNVFFGYSYYNTDLSSVGRTSTNGWEASLEGHVFPFVGIVADFSGHYGSETFPGVGCPVSQPPCIPVSANISERNYLFGPRVGVSVGKIRPFAEAMFGAGHVNANSAGSDTSFAIALGGGLDYRLIRLIAWRLQGDYVQTRFFSTTQDNVRVSTGIVVRF